MMKVTPLISIIVPIYNVENYLYRCIDSIRAQTFTDFELLLIDDGSTDSSGQICDEYSERDSRIKVFHKENGGVTSARQLGLEKARGVYSIHIDGDDWILPSMLEKMYSTILQNNADILISDFYCDTLKKTIYQKQNTNSTTSIDILRDILLNKLFGSLWNKLIRHSLYKLYDINFIEGINYCEDVLLLTQLLQKNIRISFLHEAFYHYNKLNENSITTKYTLQTFQMRKKFVAELFYLLPPSFDNVVMDVAIGVKAEAFSHNILTRQEFYTYMPASLSQILRRRMGKKIKFCFILGHWGFFSIARKVNFYLQKIH